MKIWTLLLGMVLAFAGVFPAGALAEDDRVDVVKIPDLPDDFVMGMDISSLPSLLASGVVYRDFKGNVLDTPEAFCAFLKSQGITHIRVRIWHDPYDSQGKGYGGGNCDAHTAAVLAQACAENDLGMIVDLHYSDFWADPNKQQVPKAWQGFSLVEKISAMQVYTRDVLASVRKTGARVDMVQIGNETTYGFIGETDKAAMCRLFHAGAQAVRDAAPDARVMIHLTNPEKEGLLASWAQELKNHQVDYDVMGISYYPYWHGSLENLKAVMEDVHRISGKDVLIAETSYAFTLEESDWHGNTVRTGQNDTGDDLIYPFSVQGQASFLRDLMETAHAAGALGVCYWEPAWITVGNTQGLEGDQLLARLEENQRIWERHGSGWASSYAAEYDPDDAGQWFGGSAVDNQAFFDAGGQVLPSMNVWLGVRSGASTSRISVDAIENPVLVFDETEEISLPQTVTVQYNKGAAEEKATWHHVPDEWSAGVYTLQGEAALSMQVTDGAYAGRVSVPVQCTVKVLAVNLIDNSLDAGFEQGGRFTIGGKGISPIPAWDDPKEGARSMHWWLPQEGTGTVTYDVPILLQKGCYVFEAYAQGMDGDLVTLSILNERDEVLFAGESTKLHGWIEWQKPMVQFELTEETKIKLQIRVDFQPGGWGTADCLYLHRAQ